MADENLQMDDLKDKQDRMENGDATASLSVDAFNRICRLGPIAPEAWYIYAHAKLWDYGAKSFVIGNEFGSGRTMSKGKVKKAVEALADAGVFILMGPGPMSGFMVSWGPSQEDMDRFFELIDGGSTAAQASRQVVKEGAPDPGIDFWKRHARDFKSGMKELLASVGQSSGPGGEIYGHR